MDSTLTKDTLKEIEGVSKVYSVVSLHSHRKPLKQEHCLTLVVSRESRPTTKFF